MPTLTACLVALIALQDPAPAVAPIAEVTVFPGSALVRRHVEVASGSARYLIAGLPASMDAESVRVRCTGAEVVGTETRERFQKNVPDARVEELRGRLRELERELAGDGDQLEVLRTVAAHLGRLFDMQGVDEGKEPIQASPETWQRNLEYISARLGENRAAQRELRQRIAVLEVQRSDVAQELGVAGSGQGVSLRDVIVELAGGAGAASLDLEYVVANAGWTPLYDLRTAADARAVELDYRARVWQQTGEDWSEVELALSTAQPRLGAQGPDPEPIWLRVLEPVERKAELRRRVADSDDFFLGRGEKANDAGTSGDEPAARPFASVDSQGLSLRFRLATRESVQSRPEPSTVLVGQQVLEVTPEYFVAPEIDANVWLRGKCVNTTPWTLLPGRAAVYFGADFLGHASLDAVQPGAELVLHLGADPAFTVERTVLEDVVQGPGVFGSKATHKQAFRIRLKNNGAAVARADGAALVFVREVLPKATDERIKVEISDSSPKPSDDARWKKEREERGLVTWAVAVPRGGEKLVEYVRKISYPDGATVYER